MAVSVSISSELEEELPVMTTGADDNLPGNNVAIGPWHGSDLSESFQAISMGTKSPLS